MAVLSPVIVWFRKDLRLADNPALTEAAKDGRPIIPIYIHEEDSPRPEGSAQRWWLHHSLSSLGRSLARAGAPLLLRKGRARDILPRLAADTGARCVVWNRRSDPLFAAIDRSVAQILLKARIQVSHFDSELLFDPADILDESDRPISRFVPFWRRCLDLKRPGAALPAPPSLTGYPLSPSLRENWDLDRSLDDCSIYLDGAWSPGEDAAQARLIDFSLEELPRYELRRHILLEHGTSRLSPYLAFGEISPRQIWSVCEKAGQGKTENYLRELGWREFHAHNLHHRLIAGEAAKTPLELSPPTEEERLKWAKFVTGNTGVPIIDAAMRTLLETGWLHHRLRLLVGHFMLKCMEAPRHKGEAWFAESMVDACPASNIGNWRALDGLDGEGRPDCAKFDPVAVGEKLDPKAGYIRRWTPELADLPNAFVHRPWEATGPLLRKAKIELGKDYPPPMIPPL